jgi:type II secretory pathway component PulF
LLEADLAKGVPLSEAMALRNLPDFYRQMMLVGVRSNDLPGVLTLVADYYHKVNFISTRLKGLMVYPVIVLVASLGLSFFLATLFRDFTQEIPGLMEGVVNGIAVTPAVPILLWMPVILLSAVAIITLLILTIPALRRWLQWRFPGFKEAGLSRLAWAMRVMLKGGSNLGDALGLLRSMERRSSAGKDVARWKARLAAGHATFAEISAESKVIPPLFSWLVSSGDEDMAEGFRRAAEIYQARAVHRIEMLLYAVLPVSILFLGAMLLSQAYPMIRLFVEIGGVLDRLGP